MPNRTVWYSCLLVATWIGVAGCDAEYYAHLFIGQAEVLARTRPINDAISDGSLSESERRRLILTKDVRRFGIEVIGLTETSAYTLFDPNGTEPAAYILSAADRHQLVSYQWNFLLLGTAPQKGYFDLEMAQEDARQLRDGGYDVWLGAADGFSTLGLLPDPVRQSNLHRSDAELAELILHEMTHSTVYKNDDTDFNEAMATFVGRAAGLRYFVETYGETSAEALAAAARYEDEAVVDEFVVLLYDEAKSYYDQAAAEGRDAATIVAGREAVFAATAALYATDFEPRLNHPEQFPNLRELEINNAVLLSGVRYQSGLSDFAEVLEAAGGDFPLALEIFSQATGVEDSRSYLRGWAREQ